MDSSSINNIQLGIGDRGGFGIHIGFGMNVTPSDSDLKLGIVLFGNAFTARLGFNIPIAFGIRVRFLQDSILRTLRLHALNHTFFILSAGSKPSWGIRAQISER